MRKTLALLILLCAAVAAFAEVRLPALFSDGMVLQCDAPVPVWGWAAPDEFVTVEFAGQSKQAQADADGRWRTTLQPMPPSATSRTLTVRGSQPETETKIENVLVGEVWICSGQSNMDMSVAREDRYWCGVTNEAAEVAAAQFPGIREFRVRVTMTDEPQTDVSGTWAVSSPETVGKFSATAYFFARELHRKRGVPVGLLTSCYGASTAEAWISRPALAAQPGLGFLLEKYDAAVKAFATNATAREKYREAQQKHEVAAAKARAEGKNAPRAPKNPDPGQDQHNPCVLYNGMIAPLLPVAIRGALWYQGESNGPTAEQYRQLMETLIRDWRQRWRQGDFPFLFVQLANYGKPPTQPLGSDRIPLVREAQLQTLAVPNTAMASAVDIGDATNIHPKNKQEVGRRLALAARALAYGEKTAYSGPLFDSMTLEGNTARLRFKHTDGGLAARGEKLTGFVIAGEDGKFVWADAKMDGETVVVSSPEVAKPVAVRYGWADNPAVNLYNGAGLPASPFRTDVTENAGSTSIQPGIPLTRTASTLASIGGEGRGEGATSSTVDAATMQRIYDEAKTPFKYGVVLPAPSGKMVDCPNVFQHGDKWFMIYVQLEDDPKGYTTQLAESDDLLYWTPRGTILERGAPGSWDFANAAGGVALFDTTWGGSNQLQTHDGRYWVSYLGGANPGYETIPLSISLAFTDDPSAAKPWQKLPVPVLKPSDADTRPFESETLFKSYVFRDEARTLGAPFVMFYNARAPKDSERIGVAVSQDLKAWKRFGDGPVLANERPSGLKHGVISGDPQIVRMHDAWVMFYFGAFWKPGAFDTFAASRDLTNWTKWTGPDLVAPSEPWDREFAHKPWLLKHDGVVYHYYCAVGDQGRVIALATSKDLKSGSTSSVSSKPTLFLIGDSTVNNSTRGQMGWGTPLPAFFDTNRIAVVNRGRGGRSSRTFLTEGLWSNVLAELKPGDFVLMQFGHNDGGPMDEGRARASIKGVGDESRVITNKTTGVVETVHSYGWYLRTYVSEAKAKGATPIVLSPVPRNIWKDGKVARASSDYGKWAEEVASSEGVPFINLNEIIAQHYEQDGPEKVQSVYFTAADHTHTTPVGAEVNAASVVEGIRGLKGLNLRNFLRPL